MGDQERRVAEKLSPKHADAVEFLTFPVKAATVRDHLFTVCRQCGYETPKIDDPTRMVTAVRSIPIAPPLSGTRRTALSLSWEPEENEPGSTLVAWIAVDQSPGSRGRPDRRAMEQMREALASVIGTTSFAIDLEAPPHDPVLGPGAVLDGLFTGNLRDYSGCAREDEVSDLREGTLPLGRWAFGEPPGPVRHGPPLYLSRYRTGARMEYNGTLVCAPQNSGKTSLIVRWAEAANRAGYNVFVVDVKGNLHQKLEGKLAGDVYYFSTDPAVVDCDRINFLGGLTAMTPEDTERIKQLVEALLPSEGWKGAGGKDEFHYRNDVVWLTALVHILKLREAYLPDRFTDEAGRRRGADLNDLYELAADEEVLYAWITELREAEAFLDEQGVARPACGVDHWVREAIHLLDPRKAPPRFLLTAESLRRLRDDGVPPDVVARVEPLTDRVFSTAGLFLDDTLATLLSPDAMQQYAQRFVERARLPGEGEREPDHGYRDYTQGIVTALEPFSRHGTLYEKIRDGEPGEQFALEDLGRSEAQVTIILAAREQDLDKATTVLALAIKRLQHFLFERVNVPDEELRPVLLLLDETRRIRAFEANKYITYAREAKAGCVVVYQSLDQIGDARKLMEVLENVGTQIYLGSLVGNTAGYFVHTLPRRYRAAVTEQVTYGQDGRTRTLLAGKELVEYLTTNELYRLPAGEWPALVYVNDQPRRKPILVDMHDPSLG
jgi:hypothetical protein